MTDTESNANYLDWKSRIDSLSYKHQQDLAKIESSKLSVYQLYRRKEIMPETPVLLSLSGRVNLASFGNDEVPVEFNSDPQKLIKYKSFLTNWNLVNIH